MKHRKKPFSCFVLNPCYITPCFINQCFITPCFINQFFITPCFINQFFITPCFINSCFVTPCFINPCFVNPVQSIFYHMPINTRCPWETHVTWLLQTGCSCLCGLMCLPSVASDSSWVQLLHQTEIQHQFSASSTATSRNIRQRSSLSWHCSLKHWHWLRVRPCNYRSPVSKKH